jgi:uroporphyrinogen decarboxylase
MDLVKIMENFGDNCVVAGNVDPSVIQCGTTEQVYELTGQCIEKGKRAPGGYMLMPGCELPPKAPPYNVYMMKKAIDRFGSYE